MLSFRNSGIPRPRHFGYYQQKPQPFDRNRMPPMLGKVPGVPGQCTTYSLRLQYNVFIWRVSRSSQLTLLCYQNEQTWDLLAMLPWSSILGFDFAQICWLHYHLRTVTGQWCAQLNYQLTIPFLLHFWGSVLFTYAAPMWLLSLPMRLNGGHG